MTRPIRILHVLGTLDRGGAETLIMNIYRNIDRSKIQFDFAIHTNKDCDYNSEVLSLGGRIYNFPKFKVYNYINYKKKWEMFFKKHRFSAIHGHMDSTATIYLKEAKKYNIKTISHIHNSSSGKGIKSKIKDFMHKDILKCSDYRFACSEEAGNFLYGDTENLKNYKIINNSIETHKFSYNKNTRQMIRNDLNIKNKLVIGHVGNYRIQKNHKFILEIFEEVYNKNKDTLLVLVGSGVEENLSGLIKNSKIKNNIRFLGPRDDVNELMQAFDIFLLPSKKEGLGIVLIEAQASGLFCLASNKVPKSTKITNNIDYLPIDKKDSTKIWAKKILCNKNYHRKDQSEEILKNDYDIKSTVNYLESFYLSI